MEGNILAALALTLLAGLATGIGSLAAYFIPKPDLRYLSLSLGFAAGVMIYVGFVDLFCSSKNVLGFAYANIFFLIGLILIYFLDRAVPHIHIDGQVDSQCNRLYRSGIMTTIGIAIHNLPEGMTVALVSLADLRLGVPVAIAIAIHNIPEGLACSIPLYCATSDRKKSCLLSFAAGMTEPLGAILAVLLLYPFLNDWLLAAASAMVAGIMVFLCFDELIPIANRYGSEHVTNMGIIAGFAMMMIGLSLMGTF
ncbi:MAG: zinc transporter ZupT [Methanothrix sp.]|nr:zinc transporter ZupT [Methanothrix sp.]HNU39432.1 zinc transporter ZupT [Methanothrix sp.]HPA97107.1 zinc transporter ZupT [Methanothrix sp.]HQQ37228.1 zinc transporter ZupT [Methanothrix sp.]